MERVVNVFMRTKDMMSGRGQTQRKNAPGDNNEGGFECERSPSLD
jgi:hypothetical protein